MRANDPRKFPGRRQDRMLLPPYATSVYFFILVYFAFIRGSKPFLCLLCRKRTSRRISTTKAIRAPPMADPNVTAQDWASSTDSARAENTIKSFPESNSGGKEWMIPFPSWTAFTVVYLQEVLLHVPSLREAHTKKAACTVTQTWEGAQEFGFQQLLHQLSTFFFSYLLCPDTFVGVSPN